jgi:hypothetical protein
VCPDFQELGNECSFSAVNIRTKDDVQTLKTIIEISLLRGADAFAFAGREQSEK